MPEQSPPSLEDLTMDADWSRIMIAGLVAILTGFVAWLKTQFVITTKRSAEAAALTPPSPSLQLEHKELELKLTELTHLIQQMTPATPGLSPLQQIQTLELRIREVSELGEAFQRQVNRDGVGFARELSRQHDLLTGMTQIMETLVNSVSRIEMLQIQSWQQNGDGEKGEEQGEEKIEENQDD